MRRTEGEKTWIDHPPAPPTPPRKGPVERFLETGPVRRFLATHDVHILPHRVSHSKRAKQAMAIGAVALVVFGAWWWVVPRTDVVVEAQYHEGLFNSIAVDVKVVNGGTVGLRPVHLEVVVTDLSNRTAMGFFVLNATVEPHRTFDARALEFKGDQITTDYGISVLVSFDTGGGRTTKTFDFRTEEPYMNLYFKGRVA